MNILEKAEKYRNGARVAVDWLGSGGIVVSQELAQKRADVCHICNHNKSESTFQHRLSESIHAVIEIKNGLELHVNGELGVCDVCLCMTSCKVWVPIEHLLKAGDELPSHCWQTTEIK